MQKIYRFNTGLQHFPVNKLLPNEEFGEVNKGKNVIQMMLSQTVELFRSHPRSIITISAIQFGIYFVCNGMLLFFPDILNQTAKFNQRNSTESSNVQLCYVVETAIRERKAHSEVKCIDDLDISSYYYALILEICYTVGFLIISWLVNYSGRLAIFSFIFFTTSFCGFAINYTGTVIGTYLYVWLLASGINNTLLNTVTYDLFPTNLRSLAMSLSLMFGRLGSLVGVNVAGYLLEEFCRTTFTLSGALMLTCGILTFFIPHIMKKK
jgi:MFS transporter, VNT family, synaptic vesicle glycoprotein 2